MFDGFWRNRYENTLIEVSITKKDTVRKTYDIKIFIFSSHCHSELFDCAHFSDYHNLYEVIYYYNTNIISLPQLLALY